MYLMDTCPQGKELEREVCTMNWLLLSVLGELLQEN